MKSDINTLADAFFIEMHDVTLGDIVVDQQFTKTISPSKCKKKLTITHNRLLSIKKPVSTIGTMYKVVWVKKYRSI